MRSIRSSGKVIFEHFNTFGSVFCSFHSFLKIGLFDRCGPIRGIRSSRNAHMHPIASLHRSHSYQCKTRSGLLKLQIHAIAALGDAHFHDDLLLFQRCSKHADKEILRAHLTLPPRALYHNDGLTG